MKSSKKHNRKETRIVTREEEIQIVAALRRPECCEAKSYYADVADLVEVIVDTGLRPLEALELMYRDINFTDNMILARATKGKNRRVPISSRVASILKRRRALGQDKPFILNQIQIHKAWSWARTQIKVADTDKLLLYSLRKTCAQRLFDAGINMGIICEWLGHTDIRYGYKLAPLSLKKLTDAANLLEQYNQSHYQ
jgi:integrase